MSLQGLKGQSVLEYGVVVAVLAVAFFGMQFYMKRALQSKYRQYSESVGEQEYIYRGTLGTSSISSTSNTKDSDIQNPIYDKKGLPTGKTIPVARSKSSQNIRKVIDETVAR